MTYSLVFPFGSVLGNLGLRLRRLRTQASPLERLARLKLKEKIFFLLIEYTQKVHMDLSDRKAFRTEKHEGAVKKQGNEGNVVQAPDPVVVQKRRVGSTDAAADFPPARNALKIGRVH